MQSRWSADPSRALCLFCADLPAAQTAEREREREREWLMMGDSARRCRCRRRRRRRTAAQPPTAAAQLSASSAPSARPRSALPIPSAQVERSVGYDGHALCSASRRLGAYVAPCGVLDGSGARMAQSLWICRTSLTRFTAAVDDSAERQPAGLRPGDFRGDREGEAQANDRSAADPIGGVLHPGTTPIVALAPAVLHPDAQVCLRHVVELYVTSCARRCWVDNDE